MSLKSKIQALITAANAKTGETDATLTDAVQTLVDGYGQGITPTGNINITENGTYDVSEYAEAVVDVSGGGTIPHTHYAEFTPATDTKAITIPLPFTYTPSAVKIYTDDTIPTPTGANQYIRMILATNISSDKNNSTLLPGDASLGGRAYVNKSGGTDYWNLVARTALAPSFFTFDWSESTTAIFFAAGVTYKAIAVEDI